MATHATTRRLAILASACATCMSIGAAPAVGGPQETGRSPDHGQIAFFSFDPNDEDDTPTTVQVVSPSNLDTRTLTNYGGDPHWAPGGRQIVVDGCSSAHPSCVATIVRADGLAVRELFMPGAFPADSTAFSPVVWSPDARRLAGGVDSSEGDLNGIYLIRASDGGGLTRVTSNPGGEDIPGSFSPNGRWIVFVRDLPAGDDLVADGLYAVRTDGTHLHPVTPPGMLVNAEHGGRWSPDGRTILFDARPDADSRFTLWTIHPDGNDLNRLPIQLNCGAATSDATSFGCFAPAWSPDGRRIVFGTNDAATGSRNLFTVGADGTQLRQITNLETTAADVPDWGQ